MQDPFTLYFYHRSGKWNGKHGERYTVFDSTGVTLAEGLGRQKSLVLQLEVATPAGPLRFSNQLRKTFAFSGKVDALLPDGSLSAIVTRSLRVLGADEEELLRLQDPTSWKENLAESLVDALGNALLSGGDTPGGSARHRYLLLRNDAPCGTLTREKLPFFPQAPREPGPLGKRLRKLLPKRWTAPQTPHAWSLRIQSPETLRISEPALLNSMATLLELIRWSR